MFRVDCAEGTDCVRCLVPNKLGVMKWMPLVLSGVFLAFAGCGGSETSSTTETNAPSSGNPLTAPVDYLGAVGEAKQRSIKTIDTASLTKAIQMFHVSEGRFPKELNELVQLRYIAKIPEAPHGQKIIYNATNGQVAVVPE